MPAKRAKHLRWLWETSRTETWNVVVQNPMKGFLVPGIIFVVSEAICIAAGRQDFAIEAIFGLVVAVAATLVVYVVFWAFHFCYFTPRRERLRLEGQIRTLRKEHAGEIETLTTKHKESENVLFARLAEYSRAMDDRERVEKEKSLRRGVVNICATFLEEARVLQRECEHTVASPFDKVNDWLKSTDKTLEIIGEVNRIRYRSNAGIAPMTRSNMFSDDHRRCWEELYLRMVRLQEFVEGKFETPYMDRERATL